MKKNEIKIGDLFMDLNHCIACIVIGIREETFHKYEMLGEDGLKYYESLPALSSKRYEYVKNIFTDY